jgi:hypothetical protein
LVTIRFESYNPKSHNCSERDEMVDEATTPATPDDATLAFWAKMSGWRAGEAAALLLDRDPDQIQPFSHPDTQVEFHRLKRLLARAGTMGELEIPTPPRVLLEWAISNGLDVPERLNKAVAQGKALTNWRSKAMQHRRELRRLRERAETIDDLETKALTSIYSILLGVAKDKFLFKDGNNEAATNIAKALVRQGFDSPKAPSIRTWLQKAKEMLET